jgi:predicted CxxxxCH...CXXCH cytochrome family protein
MNMVRTTNIKKSFFVLAIISLVLAGCSSPNNSSPFSDGSHPSDWLPAGHSAAASSNITVCESCHGSDLSGGISGVSCTSCHIGSTTTIHPAQWDADILTQHGVYAAANTTQSCANAYCHGTNLRGVANSGPSCVSCHLGGPTSPHPANWAVPIALNHADYVQSNGTSGCANANCHGSDLSGVAGSGPSCTSCHIGTPTSVHPVSWGTGSQILLNHAPYIATNGTVSCQNNYCHGADLGGISNSGPGCVSCHINGVFPFTATGCVSCHGSPPNTPDAHNTVTGHFASQVILPDSCNTCHSGAGYGTIYHFDGIVEVNIEPKYSSFEGLAFYDQTSGTCSFVSCHGGSRTQSLAQALAVPPVSTLDTTPTWSGGSITISTQCEVCHVYEMYPDVTEANNYGSGQHELHLFDPNNGPQPKLYCTDCHDTTLLSAVHFKTLTSPMSALVASSTIASFIRFDGTNCNGGCHSVEPW